MTSKEVDYQIAFANRISNAVESLFGDQAITHRVRGLVDDFHRQCDQIVHGRGVPLLTVAMVGAKGQGKSWIARQFIKSLAIRSQLPSGVLGREATTRLYWVGPASPESIDPSRETFIPCDAQGLIDLGQPYMLLDTPGVTDSDRTAVETTRGVLSLAPVKLLVIRRDQLRASINSEIASWIEGAVCLPIVTCIPANELDGSSSQGDPTSAAAGASQSVDSGKLAEDLRHLIDWLRASAPQTQLLEPILVEDFEASGEEMQAGERMVAKIHERLRSQPLESLNRTRSKRLTAINHKLRRDVSRMIDNDTPYLASAVRRLHEEAEKLPLQVLETVLGSSWILQTAVRSRLRARLVADTSPLWFPYRSLLSLLSFSQGAWDRLILAFTGSVPSLFGTLANWAKNLQQSHSVSQEMQTGIRERLLGQVSDRLEPIHRQFHNALHRLKHGDQAIMQADVPRVRLGGIEELQSQSRLLFEQKLEANAVGSFGLQATGCVASLAFWGMMLGPIVSVYRRYFHASYQAIAENSPAVEEFPHESAQLIFTSALLSIIPIFIFAMIAMTFFLRGSKIHRIVSQVQSEHHQLLEQLRRDGVLRLHFEDKSLELAEFLIHLDRGIADSNAKTHGS